MSYRARKQTMQKGQTQKKVRRLRGQRVYII